MRTERRLTTRASAQNLQAEPVEAIVKTCSPGHAPKAPIPAVSVADGEPDRASVGLVSVKIDVADEVAFVNRPEPDQFRGWRLEERLVEPLALGEEQVVGPVSFVTRTRVRRPSCDHVGVLQLQGPQGHRIW